MKCFFATPFILEEHDYMREQQGYIPEELGQMPEEQGYMQKKLVTLCHNNCILKSITKIGKICKKTIPRASNILPQEYIAIGTFCHRNTQNSPQFVFNKNLILCELRQHTKFPNQRITPSGRKGRHEREKITLIQQQLHSACNV